MKTLLYSDDITDMYLEDFDGNFFIHMDVKKWGVKEYKKLLTTSLKVQEYLISEGVNTLYMATPLSNKKLLKFAGMFGFIPLVQCDNIFIMYLEMM